MKWGLGLVIPFFIACGAKSNDGELFGNGVGGESGGVATAGAGGAAGEPGIGGHPNPSGGAPSVGGGTGGLPPLLDAGISPGGSGGTAGEGGTTPSGGGTNAGGSAGIGGGETGGTGGAGGSGGEPPVTCGGATPTTGCETCLYKNCCAQAVTCTNSWSCQSFISCAQSCWTQWCVDSCAQGYPLGAQIYIEYDSCSQNSCASSC